jgi:cytochrome P450
MATDRATDRATDSAFSGARELFDFDPARVACPYPTFTALRDAAPVAWFEEIEAFVVTRYDLIVEILRQPEIFSSRSATGPVTDREMMTLLIELATEDPEIAALAEGIMQSSATAVLLQADPPEHPRQRALVNRAFTPGAIRRIEPYMEQLAHELIDGFASTGRVELLRQFSVPFPMTVIAKALGVSLDRMDDFMRWSKTLVAGIGKRDFGKPELAEIMRTRAVLSDYLMSVVVEREAKPQDDLISQLVVAEIDGQRLTHGEVVGMVVQFLLAGNDTTAKLLASAMLRLAQDPELADQLRADATMIPAFVEEALRLTPPINGTYRVVDGDVELGGVAIPAGSAIWMVYAAGNRDPEHFDQPDVLQCPQASKTPHLTFGFGAHFCLGASLARAESRIALEALLARCDDIRLDVDLAEVPYDQSFMLHGVSSLPLAFQPKDRALVS